MKRKIAWLLPIFFLVAFHSLSSAPVAAPYYEGKVISILVGQAAGSGYDLLARVVAKHLPKHIPGTPIVIVQNMPGANSIIAANHLYNVSKPDGLTIGHFNKGLPVAQLLKVEGVKYDLNKFQLIGSASIDCNIFVVRSDLPYKTPSDLMAAEKIFMAGHGPAGGSTQIALILKDFTGMKIQVVMYRNNPAVFLGIERKEADGVCIAYNTGRPYIARGLVRPILRSRIPKAGIHFAEIENLPLYVDFIKDPMGKTLMEIFSAEDYAGKPFFAPPNTPTDLVKILRDAFAETVQDHEFEADAQKALIDTEYVSAEECSKAMKYVLNQPAEVVKILNKYVKF
jgi:tripartite-type tricarboxylate transporter receptor subunit TctC